MVDDDVERDLEGEWGSELSLDSDAIDDYMRNCMDDSDDSDDDDDDSDDAFDEDAAAGRRRRRSGGGVGEI